MEAVCFSEGPALCLRHRRYHSVRVKVTGTACSVAMICDPMDEASTESFIPMSLHPLWVFVPSSHTGLSGRGPRACDFRERERRRKVDR